MANTPMQRHIAAMTGAERRKARENLEKTQQDVAVECGVSVGTVRNWEHQENPVTPQKSKAAAYARALGVEVTLTGSQNPSAD